MPTAQAHSNTSHTPQVEDEILPVSPSERFEDTTNDHLSGLRLAQLLPHFPTHDSTRTPAPRTTPPRTHAELFIALSLNWLHCVLAHNRLAAVGVPLAPSQPCKTESSSFGRPARAGLTELRQTLCFHGP